MCLLSLRVGWRAIQSACGPPGGQPRNRGSFARPWGPTSYRDYACNTIERIQLTRELQAIGFTLNDVVGALAADDAGGATCESEQWRLEAVLNRVEARLAELNALRRRILQAQEACAAGRCKFTTPGNVDATRSVGYDEGRTG